MNPHESALHAGGPTRSDRTTTVFLADDDADFRELVYQRLSADGYEVTVALDGGEALQRLAALVDAELPLPDILILDFVMPKLSGLGVLRALWRLGHVPPTLIVTGFADPSVEAFARNLGALRVLRKPIGDEELCAAIAEARALSRKLRDSDA